MFYIMCSTALTHSEGLALNGTTTNMCVKVHTATKQHIYIYIYIYIYISTAHLSKVHDICRTHVQFV